MSSDNILYTVKTLEDPDRIKGGFGRLKRYSDHYIVFRKRNKTLKVSVSFTKTEGPDIGFGPFI